MAEPLRIIGYHGTSVRAARSILRRGFRLSRNDYDWLGDGVYFFQDAPLRARDWATSQFGADAAVVRSSIRLDDCVDLVDLGWFEHLAAAYTSLIELARRDDIRLPRQTSGAHRVDREIFNHAASILARRGTIVRAVRGVFVEGVPLFPGSAIFSRAHIQIAVRDTSLIEESLILLDSDGDA